MILGWVFTEMGRQPWLVFGLLQTEDGVSPGVTGLEVLISLTLFTLVYGSLAVVEFRLIKKAAMEGPAVPAEPDEETGKPLVHTTVY
jgi:cytochrome d ubiquinol oxidase subunit I